MAAYDMLMRLVQDYYIDLGYNNLFVENYFSNQTFKEMISNSASFKVALP